LAHHIFPFTYRALPAIYWYNNKCQAQAENKTWLPRS